MSDAEFSAWVDRQMRRPRVKTIRQALSRTDHGLTEPAARLKAIRLYQQEQLDAGRRVELLLPEVE